MKGEQTNRQRRRRRRVRNQIIAYLISLVVAVLVAVAGYFGVKAVIGYVKDYNNKVGRVIEEAESNLAAEEEDESYSVPEPEEPTEDSSGEPAPVQPETDPLEDLVGALIKDMTLEEMVAGLFMVSPESITGVQTAIQAGDDTKAALAADPVGGFIYSAKNFKSEEQFAEMMAKTKEFAVYPLFLAVAVESGDEPGFGLGASAKASELADADAVREAYGGIAAKLAAYGINMDLAPVAETAPDDGEGPLKGRVFSPDAATAAPLVDAAVQALQEAKVSAVLQKFPGTAIGAKTLEELNNSEFIIYAMNIQDGVDCIMMSNAPASGVTGDDTPASLSSVMISDVLRGSLGFDGVVITDYLNDSAITGKYSSAEAAVAAIGAGADVLLEPEDYREAYEGILQAVADGRITEERIRESIIRIYRVKYKTVVGA